MTLDHSLDHRSEYERLTRLVFGGKLEDDQHFLQLLVIYIYIYIYIFGPPQLVAPGAF